MLHLRQQNGLGKVKKFNLGESPAFYFAPSWSPDSKKIAYLDNWLGVWYIDLDQGKPLPVDKDYYASDRDLTPAWSPDGKWLAYSKSLKSHMRAIYIYSLANAKSAQVTDGMSEAKHPILTKTASTFTSRPAPIREQPCSPIFIVLAIR